MIPVAAGLLFVGACILWLGRTVASIRWPTVEIAACLKEDNYQSGLIDKLETERARLMRSLDMVTEAIRLADLEKASLHEEIKKLKAEKLVFPDLIKLDDGVYELSKNGEMNKVGQKRIRIDDTAKVDPDPAAPRWPS